MWKWRIIISSERIYVTGQKDYIPIKNLNCLILLNKSLISAISNDLHFSEIFSYQLKIFAKRMMYIFIQQWK